jgi:hypothetical protein
MIYLQLNAIYFLIQRELTSRAQLNSQATPVAKLFNFELKILLINYLLTVIGRSKGIVNGFISLAHHSNLIHCAVETVTKSIFTLLQVKKVIAAVVVLVSPPASPDEDFFAFQHDKLIHFCEIYSIQIG